MEGECSILTLQIQRYSPTEALELLDLGTSFLRRARDTAQLDMQHSSSLAAHLTLFSDTLQCIVDVDRRPLFNLWSCPHRAVSDDLYLRSTPGHLGLSVDLLIAINGVMMLNEPAHDHAFAHSGGGRVQGQAQDPTPNASTAASHHTGQSNPAGSPHAHVITSVGTSTSANADTHGSPSTLSTCAQRLLRDIAEAPAIPPSSEPGDSATQLSHTAMHELWRQACLVLLHTVGLGKGCLAREVQKCVSQVRLIAPVLCLGMGQGQGQGQQIGELAEAPPFWASAAACPWFIIATAAIQDEDRHMCRRALRGVGTGPQYVENARFIEDYWKGVDESGRTECWRRKIKEGGYRLGFL